MRYSTYLHYACFCIFYLDCSSVEVQAKIEFLEKNVSLILSECEALEMYMIKIHPEYLETSKNMLLIECA